ncbi:MAG: hypothetical protein IPG07_08465 [Crocinitomicaceae bacterium]|nr:hypothetical protein [Crocinitomicaceae bacterium]
MHFSKVDESFDEGLDAIDALEDAIQQSPNSSPTWAEILARFKRGNDFNRKARNVYTYNEIVLTNGKRLDSYIPGDKIISRKATDIANITEQTWRNYSQRTNYEVSSWNPTPIQLSCLVPTLKWKILFRNPSFKYYC